MKLLDFEYTVMDARRGFLFSFTSTPSMVREAVYGYLAGRLEIAEPREAALVRVDEDHDLLRGVVVVWVFRSERAPLPKAPSITGNVRPAMRPSCQHGLHVAAIYTLGGEKLVEVLDVDESTAVAKAAGYILLSGGSREPLIAYTSARLRRASVYALARAGVGLIVASSPPLESGVRASHETGLRILVEEES